MYSIIITTYGIGGISLTESLINSISKFENPNLDEIIISNDGNDDEIIALLNLLKDRYKEFDIKLLCNPFSHSFSKTVNNGIKVSKNDNDILLLNNDMIALTDFESFVYFKENNDKVGIIGAKLLYPDKKIQHSGMSRRKFLYTFKHVYRYKDENHPPANITKKYIAVTGACQYINRKLINIMGYYDEDYILSYEDVDYCINAQLNGYDVWYIPYVVMIHYESLTRKDDRYHNYNYNIFWKKWGNKYKNIDPEIRNEEYIKLCTLGLVSYLIFS